MLALKLVPAGFGLLAAYILLLLVHPVHRCPGCRGRKSVPFGTGRRPCPSCKSVGRVRRPGSALAHRAVREHLWPWLRDRMHDAIERRLEKHR